MKERWLVAAKKADFQAIGEKFGIDPVLARIIRNRDLLTDEEIAEFLDGDIGKLPDPFLLPDMEAAVDTLLAHRERKVRIIGDYDIDGVCASYILYRGLSALGFCVDTAIPHRITDGYGLNERLVEEAKEDGVDLIITCDNGIAAAGQTRLAKELGMEMIVTDHHEIPYEEETGEDGSVYKKWLLPEAAAVVDPKREESAYPYEGICGAFVAFHVIRALYQRVKEQKNEGLITEAAEDAALMDELMELTAFATIGDVMELRKENRTIVRYGLKRMNHSANVGLRALIAVSGLEGKKISPYHVGFVLGPCMNATGRLDSAARAFELLCAKDYKEALGIAQELKGLNDSRKDLTKKGVDQAIARLEDWNPEEEPVIVQYLPECHESLAGIIAGRIREKYNHPVFVLTPGEEGVKGSGRSIESYSMYEELCKCKELFTKFGGHRMAAGVSMPLENVELFRKQINSSCTLKPEDFVKTIHIDVPMPMSYVTRRFVEQMEILEPFGNGNPKPVFAQKNLTFLSAKLVGKNNRVMNFVVADEYGQRFTLTYFSEHESFDAYITEEFGAEALERLYQAKGNGEVVLSVVYYPDLNEFRGRCDVQYVMNSYCR